ncbi:C4-dicarboxylate ABC transporter [Allostella sp. ATCC 35155]|nr:C4-dicarboxylate ABC transporter [Stella sp. ATCC 35155]
MRYCGAALAASAMLAAGAALAADPITLRLADNLPPTHFLAKYGTHYFMEEVTKATNGRVKFEYFPAEQVGKAKDMLALTQSGVVDIALIVPAYISDKLPLSGVVDLPGSFASSCEGTLAFWKSARDGWLAKNEFQPSGVRVVFSYVNPPYELFMSKEGAIRLEDMKGRKIRSVGGALDITLRNLGAVPVRLTAPEIRESLSRGTVDGIVFPVPTVTSYKLEGLIKSVTSGASLAGIATTYAINEARWKKLPADVQKAIMEVGDATTRRVCKMTDADVAKSYETFKQQGMTISRIGPEDQKVLDEVYQQARRDWAAGLDRRGKPGSEALKMFSEALAAGK